MISRTRDRILLLLAAVLVLLLVPVPRASREFHAICDLGHAPLFGLLAALLYRWCRPRLPKQDWLAAGLVWGFVSGMGLAAEVLQTVSGRHASWSDVVANMLGAAACLVWAMTFRSQRWSIRIAGVLIAGGCLAIASWEPALVLADAVRQRREMPLIGSFEHHRELRRWHWQYSRIGRSQAWASHGNYSLQVDLLPGKYQGVALYWPVEDWSVYQALEFDLFLDSDAPLPMIAKIEDVETNGDVNDRFNKRILLKPGPNRVHINLWEVAIAPKRRMLDLAHIKRLKLFTSKLSESRRLYLDNVRLIP